VANYFFSVRKNRNKSEETNFPVAVPFGNCPRWEVKKMRPAWCPASGGFVLKALLFGIYSISTLSPVYTGTVV